MALGYSVQELRASRKTGKPLDQKRAAAAQEAARRLENWFAWLGNADDNQYGILTDPNVNRVTIASDGAGASKLFSTKTPQQILRDLNQVAWAAFILTMGIEMSETVSVSPAIAALISTTMVSNLATKTILQLLQECNPQIKTVDWLNELTSFSGGYNAMFAYHRDPMKVPWKFRRTSKCSRLRNKA